MSLNSFNTKSTLIVNGKKYSYYSLKKLERLLNFQLSKLPYSLKVLLENLLRNEDGISVTKQDIENFVKWLDFGKSSAEISFKPIRVLMQDFTGVPAVVDLAAMRECVKSLGGDISKINPLAPTHLVIDHSVQVDKYKTSTALQENVELEMERNMERYQFLKWGQNVFNNFSVVPPGTGICHQVNLERIAKVVWTHSDGNENFAYPDTVVGTDSHTTMINGLSVLGWGVGGIEAEAVMLGESTTMLMPDVVGFKLTGALREGVTATDLVLTATSMLRQKGVVGKFVEFFGNGVQQMSLANRATVSNMAPEYGATCGIFGVDEKAVEYLRNTGRTEEEVLLVEAYCKEQEMWINYDSEPKYTDIVELDLFSVEPSVAGPKRPQDRVALKDVKSSITDFCKSVNKNIENDNSNNNRGARSDIKNASVAIAAITSCTNTSNPSVMVAAGLLAKKAIELGLSVPSFVKTSLAPGSQVVAGYLENSGLQKYLDALGFNVVGFGCTTCIGNSGPLDLEIENQVKEQDLLVCSVLSGNRNFEGRVHPLVKANYLASPPLVVAYAIAGTMNIDLTAQPIATTPNGSSVFLKDIWPSNVEIENVINSCVKKELFVQKYSSMYSGDKQWQEVCAPNSSLYSWNSKSTYIEHPPYFEDMKNMSPNNSQSNMVNIVGARPLLVLGDSITTDHISPAGNISPTSEAAAYLSSHGIERKDYNSYGARRGAHSVMTRGTFANIRLKNEMLLDGKEGSFSISCKTGNVVSVYAAAQDLLSQNIPAIVVAGKEYGTGSSRDWAAKGTKLLGIKAVIAESFERIHRSNLVGMGVLPLEFTSGENRKTLGITGLETFDIAGINVSNPKLLVKLLLPCTIHYKDGSTKSISLRLRIDTALEAQYYASGGIMQYVIKKVLSYS